MSHAFWSKMARDLESRTGALPEFEERSSEELRSLPRASPTRRGMSELQYSASMFPSPPHPQPASSSPAAAAAAAAAPSARTSVAGRDIARTQQEAAPASAASGQKAREFAAGDAGETKGAAAVKVGVFSGVEDTELLSEHDVAALFQRRVLESQPTDSATYRIDDSVPPMQFDDAEVQPLKPGARTSKLSINEVRGWIAHARTGGMSNSEDPLPPHLEPVIVPPSPRSRSPRTVLAQPDAGTYATADRTKGWREVVNKGAAESPSLRALRFGRREYSEQIQREFSSQVTFDFKKDPASAVASLGLDGGIEDSVDFPKPEVNSLISSMTEEQAEEQGDIVVEGTDGMQSISMAKAVAPDYSVYYAGVDDEDARDSGPTSYSPSYSTLADLESQPLTRATNVTSVVGLHGGVVVLTQDSSLPAWAQAPAQSALPGSAGFPASVSVSLLERAGASASGSLALSERAKAIFTELVSKRDLQKIRSALYFPHDFIVSGGFPSNGSGHFHSDINSKETGSSHDTFAFCEPKGGYSTADEDAQRQLMLVFDSDRRSMLHSACLRGDVDMLSVFLPPISRRVANQVLRCPDGHGRTCFHAAAMSGNSEAMLAVMKCAGADRVMDVMRDVDNAGNTCLHLAAIRGHVSMCVSLLRIWSCPVEMYNIRGYSPLHEAIEGSHIAIVKLLLEECPTHALSTLANEARDTALHIAVRMRPVSMGIVQQLVKYGCKGNRANLFGVRPTELAMEVGAWLAADIMDSSATDQLVDTQRDAQFAAAASLAAAASYPRPPSLVDYWNPIPGSHSFGQQSEHADVTQNSNSDDSRNSVYTGGDCEREIMVDSETPSVYSVDIIVVPPLGASSSERAMLAAPYSVAARMRQQTDLVLPQFTENDNRSEVFVDISLESSSSLSVLDARSSDISSHVHPSLALNFQHEQQQRQLHLEHIEKVPVAVDSLLSTTECKPHIEPKPECKNQETNGLNMPESQGIIFQLGHNPTECLAIDPSELVANFALSSDSAREDAVIADGYIAPVTEGNPLHVIVEVADQEMLQRLGELENKQQSAAISVKEDPSDRVAFVGEGAVLELDACVVITRTSSASVDNFAATAIASWTNWDEIMEPPRRSSTSTDFQSSIDSCVDTQPVLPAPATSSRLIRQTDEDLRAGPLDLVDSDLQVLYVGSDVLSRSRNQNTPDNNTLCISEPPVSFQTLSACAMQFSSSTASDSHQPPDELSHQNHPQQEKNMICMGHVEQSAEQLNPCQGIGGDQHVQEFQQYDGHQQEQPLEQGTQEEIRNCLVAELAVDNIADQSVPISVIDTTNHSSYCLQPESSISFELNQQAALQNTIAPSYSPRSYNHQLAVSVAEAARSSMLLPGGPLLVLGLPSFSLHDSIQAVAAAVVGRMITRANDVFNMRIHLAQTVDPIPDDQFAVSNIFKWSSATISDGDAFCACLRVQRVWRGHIGRMIAHIRRNRVFCASSLPEHSSFATVETTSTNLSEGVTSSSPEKESSAVDIDGVYCIPHPPGFLPPCILCEQLDHSTREHGSLIGARLINHDPIFQLPHYDAIVDRAILEDVAAANCLLPISPDVAAAVNSVEHPNGYREPCIYCERFDHASEEHSWTSPHHQRAITVEDGNSMASTHKSSVLEDADDLDDQAIDRIESRAVEVNEAMNENLLMSSSDADLMPTNISEVDSPSFVSEVVKPQDTIEKADLVQPLSPSAQEHCHTQLLGDFSCISHNDGEQDDSVTCDVSIERVEMAGNNDQGAEELDGIIVLDDTDSEADIDRSNEQIAAHLRSRLKDASEHESRMRSTISSARRFALDLERTVLMSELVGSSSSVGDAAPLPRVSPSLREQQRVRSRSAVATQKVSRFESKGTFGPNSTASVSTNFPSAHMQQSGIFGGIILPTSTAVKTRSQSATSKARCTGPSVSDSSTGLRLPISRKGSFPLRRGIYSLARAGPSIISAWESSVEAECDPAARQFEVGNIDGSTREAEQSSRTSGAKAGSVERDLKNLVSYDDDSKLSDSMQQRAKSSDFFADEVQDWLFTRESAKATASQALSLALSKKANSIKPTISDSSTAFIRSIGATHPAHCENPDTNIGGKRKSSSIKKHEGQAATRLSSGMRSSSPSFSLSQPIDPTFTTMVAGGASGTTALQRHIRREAARAFSSHTANTGSRKSSTALAVSQQLFSVIL